MQIYILIPSLLFYIKVSLKLCTFLWFFHIEIYLEFISISAHGERPHSYLT